jgi:capsular polysaccharide biosynthesis protein
LSKIVRKDTNSDGVEVNIMYAFGLLLRRLWLLILVALVVGASCAVITKAVEEPTYTLSMTFIVNNKSEKDLSSSGENSVSYNDMSASAYMANTFVHLMTGRTMCNAIAAECKSYPKTADQVAKMIAVSRKTDSSIIDMTVTASSPEEAYELAQAVKDTYKDVVRSIRAAASISATSRSCRQSRTSPSVQCATPSSALLRVQLYVRSL